MCFQYGLRQCLCLLYSRAGIFSDSCDDPTMLCDWPLWENCNDEHCNKENCCFTDGMRLEPGGYTDSNRKMLTHPARGRHIYREQ